MFFKGRQEFNAVRSKRANIVLCIFRDASSFFVYDNSKTIKMIKIFLIFFCFYAQKAEGQSPLRDIFTNIRNIAKENSTLNRIPQIDAIGMFVRLIDRFLTEATKGRPPPKSNLCDTHLIHLGEFELKFSQQPRGFCTYCCRLIKPVKYVRLYFANNANGGNTIQLKMSKKPGALHSAGVDNNSPTVIFIHGFGEHGLGPAPTIIKDSYLSTGMNYNIILVDWGDLTAMPWYPQAVKNTKLVGNILYKFIKFYNDTGELPISNVHIVGFSLGAHMAGFIGKRFKGEQRIPRITGLDPAFPLYPFNDTWERLVKEDAEFVDVIHTDGGKFGYPISIGHADFYPNGGSFMQPGCTSSNLANERKIEQYISCDHLRAWHYYAESVRNPTAFPATKCGIMREGSFKECRFITDGYMGFMASKNTTGGDFYLTTNNQKPYSKSAANQQTDMKTINLVL